MPNRYEGLSYWELRVLLLSNLNNPQEPSREMPVIKAIADAMEMAAPRQEKRAA